MYRIDQDEALRDKVGRGLFVFFFSLDRSDLHRIRTRRRKLYKHIITISSNIINDTVRTETQDYVVGTCHLMHSPLRTSIFRVQRSSMFGHCCTTQFAS